MLTDACDAEVERVWRNGMLYKLQNYTMHDHLGTGGDHLGTGGDHLGTMATTFGGGWGYYDDHMSGN